jgi:hypothetical protein
MGANLLFYVAEGPSWVSYFDNTNWSGSSGTTWDGSKWVAGDNGGNGWVALNKIGTWYIGLRPTHIRVTATNNSADIDLQVNADHFTILDDENYQSGNIVALDFSGGEDIDGILMRVFTDPSWECTNIEFLI